jgi:hypothetical protein
VWQASLLLAQAFSVLVLRDNTHGWRGPYAFYGSPVSDQTLQVEQNSGVSLSHC